MPLYQQSWDWPLDTSTGYLIAEAAGTRLLIDTGSPLTICESEFEFGGQIQFPRANPIGFTIENVRQGVGGHVDALVGMDLLCNFDVHFKTQDSSVEFHGQQVESQNTALPISLNNSLPQLQVNLPLLSQARIIFDTGAPISYLRSDLLGDASIVGQSVDFYPMFGRFETEVYRLPFSIAGETWTGEFGLLPESLEDALLAQNIDGIIGSQLIANSEAVLATRRRKLYITTDA